MSHNEQLSALAGIKGQHDTLVINVPTEFNFKPNLEYLKRNKNECMYVIDGDVITRVIVINGVRMLVQLDAPNKQQLRVRFLNEKQPKSNTQTIALIDYIREWFDLNTDLKPFYELAHHDALLKQPVKHFYGLRIIGIPELFEALCWGVLGQHINVHYAYTLKRQFVESFGEAVVHQGKPYWVFPSHETIARLTPEDMAHIKMTTRKSEYIIGIAKRIMDGDLTKEGLLALGDLKQIEKALVSIRGIGPWTAHYLLMRCLRYPMAFPIDDVRLLNSVKYLKQMDRKPTKAEMRQIAAPWRGWEAYATFYLWRVRYW